MVVNRNVQPEGEFGVMEILGGKYVVFTHQGPYDTLAKSYQRFFGWAISWIGWWGACPTMNLACFERR